MFFLLLLNFRTCISIPDDSFEFTSTKNTNRFVLFSLPLMLQYVFRNKRIFIFLSVTVIYEFQETEHFVSVSTRKKY
jgi:hypothetical protein